MNAKIITLEMVDPPPTKLYCPFTGSLVISAEDPLEIEARLDTLSPYLRFVLFYEHSSYPAFWAANPGTLEGEHREFQETAIRVWTTAADVGQTAATLNGDWYIDYLEKLEKVLPSSSLLLLVHSGYAINIPEGVLRNPNVHIDWDFSAGYTTAACFMTERPPQNLSFRRVKTMWDDFIPDFTPGKS